MSAADDVALRYRTWVAAGWSVPPRETMRQRAARRSAALARELDRIRDEATVRMLTATSPPTVLVAVAHEERAGVPAYDAQVVVGDPRAYRVVCAFVGCGRSFLIDGSSGCRRVYCSASCRRRALYWRRKEHAA